MRRKQRSRLVSVVLAFTLAACGGADATSEGDLGGVNEVPVTVAVMPYLSNAPFIVAAEGGAFERHGLKVELVEFRSAVETVVPFANGDIDIWQGPASPGILAAVAADPDIQIVAGRDRADPDGCTYGGLVVSEDTMRDPQWATAEGLRGLRIGGRFTFTMAQMYVDTLLGQYGLTRDDVELVEIEPPVRMDALDAGQVDAVFDTEPWFGRIREGVPSEVWMPLEEVLPGLEMGFVAFGPRVLTEEPELGERFMRGYLEGLRTYQEGKTESNLDLLEGTVGLDRAELEAACWPGVTEGGRLDPESLLWQQDYLFEAGQLDRSAPIEDLWDPSFLDLVASSAERSGTP